MGRNAARNLFGKCREMTFFLLSPLSRSEMRALSKRRENALDRR
jgi:hypothetical protein